MRVLRFDHIEYLVSDILRTIKCGLSFNGQLMLVLASPLSVGCEGDFSACAAANNVAHLNCAIRLFAYLFELIENRSKKIAYLRAERSWESAQRMGINAARTSNGVSRPFLRISSNLRTRWCARASSHCVSARVKASGDIPIEVCERFGCASVCHRENEVQV